MKEQVYEYSRISTNLDKQNIKQQHEHNQRYADKNNLEIVKSFQDIKTGKTSERKGYQKLLKQELIKPLSILTQDTDRLTRDFYDGVELEKFLIKNKIKLISTSENIDLETPNGRFMFRIKLAMNSFYVENLHQKIKIGIARAKKEGKFTGRRKGSLNKNRHLSKSTYPNTLNKDNKEVLVQMEREHKKTKLQLNKLGQYSLTIPKWIVHKVLVAEKGDVIYFDFEGGKVILSK